MNASIPLLLLVSTACIAAQSPGSGRVETCSQIWLGQRGFGASYSGRVQNDDYKFILTIPEGLTGWGADPVAPFHGFIIFLSSDDSSCIDFMINLRVDLGTKQPRPHGAKVMIGNLVGRQQVAKGKVNRTDFTNVTIHFSVAHGQDIYDGEVSLVTPTRDLIKNGPIFDAFLSRLRFYR